MREILFRGKCIEMGKKCFQWIEGFYAEDDGKPLIAINKENGLNGFFVDLSTVGQFTGLVDKNGKKIFEGDIVVVPLSGKPAKGIVEYFKTDICGFTVITQPQYSNYVLQKNYAYEVIGNIHDNPELFGVTE